MTQCPTIASIHTQIRRATSLGTAPAPVMRDARKLPPFPTVHASCFRLRYLQPQPFLSPPAVAVLLPCPGFCPPLPLSPFNAARMSRTTRDITQRSIPVGDTPTIPHSKIPASNKPSFWSEASPAASHHYSEMAHLSYTSALCVCRAARCWRKRRGAELFLKGWLPLI